MWSSGVKFRWKRLSIVYIFNGLDYFDFRLFQLFKQLSRSGSILGPLLFIIYLIGLPLAVDRFTNICLNAGDINIKLLGKPKSDKDILVVTDIDNIIQHLHNNYLLPTPTITKYTKFSTLRKTCNETFDN